MPLMKFIKSQFRVEVDPKSLMLAALLDIWNNDQSETKDYANKLLTYIHLVARIDSTAPFYKSDPGEVPFLAKSQIFRNMEHQFSEEEEVLIKNGLEVYLKDNEDVDERMLKTYSDKIDQMRLELERKDFEIIKNVDKLTGKVTFASNSKIITDTMKDIEDMLKIKDNLEVRLKNSKESDRRVKADRKPSFLETQLSKVQNEAREREAAAEAARQREQAAASSAQQPEDATVVEGSDRSQQSTVSADGTKSKTEKGRGVKAFLPQGHTRKRKPKTQEEVDGANEEF